MARPVSEKVGRGPCPSCGEPVAFRKSSGGMLTHKCDACDSSGYAEPNGEAFKKRMASLTSRSEPDAVPAQPKPAATPAPKAPQPTPETPPKKVVNSAFSLADL